MKQNFDDFAKLGDFWVSKQLDSPIMGSKTYFVISQYSAPEIIEGKNYSFEAYIWSLGLSINDFRFSFWG